MFEGREWTVPVFGAPRDALRLGRRRWDAPKAGEVLVRVKACGAAQPDLLMTTGVYPLTPVAPVTPGQEV
ncbi:MAG: alcohol dehydrogenase, partial [Pigmentiphaga sp.]